MSLASTPEAKATFINPISTDEYKKQGSDFTQKALLELKEQMKNYKPNKPKKQSIIKKNIDVVNKNDYIIESNSNSDSETDYNISDNDDNDDNDGNDDNNNNNDTNINVIIRNGKNRKNTKSDNKKNQSSELKSSEFTSAMFEKLDNDTHKILQLNTKMGDLKSACKKMDKDLHYLKLDLINCQCEKDKLITDADLNTKKIELLDNIVKLKDEKQIREQYYMKYLKIFIIIALSANAYFDYVKYILLFSSVICFYF